MADVKVFAWDEVHSHNTRKSCYMVIDGLVIDVTKFLEEHPGGEDVLLEQGGVDATTAFDEIGHSDDARELMKKMAVGKISGPAKKSETASWASTSKPVKTSRNSSSLLYIAVPAIAIAAFVAFKYLK